MTGCALQLVNHQNITKGMRSVIGLFGKSAKELQKELWEKDLTALPFWQRLLYQMVRTLFVLVRELADGQLTLRAMSLVYTTLLSLVPLIAVSFSVLKGFGVHNQLEPMLLNLVAPLGPKGVEVADKIVSFVENMRVGVLGAMGMGLLLYTVISLIQKIESAFNHMWHVETRRTLARRFSDYLSVILIGPVLVFSAMGVTASIMNTAVVQTLVSIEPFGTLMLLVSKLLPYLFVIAAFTFVYLFVPNTRVRFKSALVGGAIGGILWQTTGILFASFAAGSTKYTAVYSGFAILILFMIWLYLSWLILLFGAKVAYLFQYPEYIRLGGGKMVLSNRLRERVTLMIMALIAESYYHNGQPWTVGMLAGRLKLPDHIISEITGILKQHGVLVETGDDPPGYLPLHDPESLALVELLQIVRSAGENGALLRLDEVDQVFSALEQAADEVLDGRTVKSLVPKE
jgi:membrane protein